MQRNLFAKMASRMTFRATYHDVSYSETSTLAVSTGVLIESKSPSRMRVHFLEWLYKPESCHTHNSLQPVKEGNTLTEKNRRLIDVNSETTGNF